MPTTPFSEEHDALRDSVRRVVEGPLEDLAVRAEAGQRIQAEAVAIFRQLGLAGSDDALADVVVAEELGRLRSAGLAAVLLAQLAAADAGADAGDGIATVAEEGSVHLEDGAAFGELRMVAAGAAAACCVVMSHGLILAAERGWQATSVPAAHALRGAAPADLRLTGAAVVAAAVADQVRPRHELRTAAAAISAAWQTWNDARDYAEQRTAFGRPIGRFQVNRHALADAATRLTGAEALVHDTAWALQRDGGADTATARLVAGAVATAVTDVSLQLHGGFGYTTAFDVQRAWRDAHALRSSDERLRRRVAGADAATEQGVGL